MASAEVVIVGAGLAGLACGARLARAGMRVRIVEGTAKIGGRGGSEKRGAYTFNVGQHALYKDGAGRRVLRQLGVSTNGGSPPAAGGYGVMAGRLHTLPSGFVSLLTCGFLSPAEKLQVGRLLARLPDLRPQTLGEGSVAEWLDSLRTGPGTRALLEGLLRLTTYCAALDTIPVQVAIEQLQMGLGGGVLYLHGGWGRLVEGLEQAARQAGAEIHTRTRALEILVENNATTGVRTGDQVLRADHVVLALPPKAAAALLPQSQCLQRVSQAALRARIRLSSLTVGLSQLPRPRATFALGLDEPTYASVHSAVADLAEGERALVCVSRYLHGNEPGAQRNELHVVLDRLQPGWQAHLEESQFLPQITVGYAGRFGGPKVADTPGLWLAGDWLGEEGLLADASLASAALAADRIVSGRRENDGLCRAS